MKCTSSILSLLISVFLVACSPIQLPINAQYKLEAFDSSSHLKTVPQRTLLISQPEAITGFQTEQMLYVDKPYQLAAFRENAWVGTPANMLFPLLIQTFQSSHAFRAIASGPFANKVDYRLDSQIMAMQQNFLVKPSQFQLSLKITLTRVQTNEVLFSDIVNETITCPSETPYGGVIAANRASLRITKKISQLVIREIQHEESREHL